MEKQITIREIAERAGVSTATVSNVIHGKTKRVSPATIEQVQRIIDDMGYGHAAEAAKDNRPRMVALVINSHRKYEEAIGADPFFGKIIGLVEECLRRRGYYLMLYSTSDMGDIFQMAMHWQLAGVIALASSKNDCRKIAGLMKCPLVSIDAYGSRNEVTNITLDDEQGGRIMTEYLIERGYRSVYVCAGRDSGVDHLRYRGCQDAWKRASGSAGQLRFVALGMDREHRGAAFHDLIRPVMADIGGGRRPALFCLSDLYALEAMQYFTSNGVRIPEDLGIAGFDDIFCSAFVSPGLTTIRQDMKRKADLAVEYLVAQMENREITEVDGREISLPVRLVARGSA